MRVPSCTSKLPQKNFFFILVAYTHQFWRRNHSNWFHHSCRPFVYVLRSQCLDHRSRSFVSLSALSSVPASCFLAFANRAGSACPLYGNTSSSFDAHTYKRDFSQEAYPFLSCLLQCPLLRIYLHLLFFHQVPPAINAIKCLTRPTCFHNRRYISQRRLKQDICL